MWKNKYRILSVFVTLILLTSLLMGCADSVESSEETKQDEVIHIPVIFTVNPQNGSKSNQDLVEAFNEAYAGKYQVDVEWVMETEEEYRKNLKRQNVTDTMPAVITDLRLLPSFYQMVIKDKRVMDLAPYLEADEEWKNLVEPAVLESFMEEDGSMYLSPVSTAVFSCSGMFWNEELFAKAGIYDFPETWDEFWNCCERLEACGITPLALHTEGTAWAPMLITSAALAENLPLH
jgi:ABC-type glycerol-3-phosphate transport system substrate-binding protein